MTLYTQIAANRHKTWLFLLIYIILILVLAGSISWYEGSPFIFLIAAVITIVQGIVSMQYSDKIALSVAHAVPLSKTEYANVYNIVDNLSITAGLPMPSLYLISDSAMNAFATGKDPKHASIAITSGLLSRLNTNELTGVLAHEFSHIGNEDIRLMSMIMIMAGLIALISDIFLNNMFWGGGRRQNSSGENNGSSFLIIIALALAILAPIAATLIQLAISRKREFMADANGVLLTRYPEGLISALQKISEDEEPLSVANNATAHMYFSNPLKKGLLSNLFSTHPSISDRIASLKNGSGLS